jgi:hypothetical protein
MKTQYSTWNKFVSLGVYLILVVQLQGCARFQQTAEEHPLVFCGMGSMVTGGAVWAGCQYLLGGKTATCVISAVAVAIADGLNCWWLLKQKIVDDYDDTRKKIHYDPSQGYVVKILEFDVTPKIAHPGDEVKIRIQYALMSPNPNEEIKFERKISLPGDTKPRTELITYQPGTWGVEDFPFKIDSSAPEGKIDMTFELRLLDHDKQDSRTLCFNIVKEDQPKPEDVCQVGLDATTGKNQGLGVFVVTSASQLAIKSSPKPKSRTIGKAVLKQAYTILDIYRKHTQVWYKLKLNNGETGWLPAESGVLEQR